MRFFRLLSLGLMCAVAASGTARAETLTTATGYKLEYAVRGQDQTGPIALIVMHGKNAPAEGVLDRLTQWAARVAAQGFRVYVPVMPWSARWDGTHEDATAAIDALVDLAAKDGKKVVVGGHSMGAMFAIVYRPSSLPPSVIGKFVNGTGHMLDMTSPNDGLWRTINPSIDRAKLLETEGRKKEKTRFSSTNTVGGRYVIEDFETTPEIYLSWHDPKRLPGSLNALKTASAPMLWTIGELDPQISKNAGRDAFNIMPANPKSAHFVLEGKDHSDSLPAAIEKLVPWMKGLAAQ